MEHKHEYIKGRGAQYNTDNPYFRQHLTRQYQEGIDEWDLLHCDDYTEYIEVFPKTILNRVESPDIGACWSMNPYQGCEHGCIYCYARTTHQYWGYSAGVEFEQKILVKKNAAELLDKELRKPTWKPEVIMLSGNTDCYQPAERKYGITRRMLEVLLRFRNPVSIITKNALILRDLDLLSELSRLRLVHVSISITTLNEQLRLLLEPRTASAVKRLRVVETLAAHQIPVNVMVAPVIPALNSDEVVDIIKAAAAAGASDVHYIMVRLNGPIGSLFADWVRKNFPNRADKVLHQIAQLHGGSLSDSRFGIRMRGEGSLAQYFHDLFSLARKKYLPGSGLPPYNYDLFYIPDGKQKGLFDDLG